MVVSYWWYMCHILICERGDKYGNNALEIHLQIKMPIEVEISNNIRLRRVLKQQPLLCPTLSWIENMNKSSKNHPWIRYFLAWSWVQIYNTRSYLMTLCPLPVSKHILSGLGWASSSLKDSCKSLHLLVYLYFHSLLCPSNW